MLLHEELLAKFEKFPRKIVQKGTLEKLQNSIQENFIIL